MYTYYQCCDCSWKGFDLIYKKRIDGMIQGHCPKCNRRQQGVTMTLETAIEKGLYPTSKLSKEIK